MLKPYWSKKEIDILVKMFHAGFGVSDMLRVLKGRTKYAVLSKLNDLGLYIAHREPEVDMEEFNRLMKVKKG